MSAASDVGDVPLDGERVPAAAADLPAGRRRARTSFSEQSRWGRLPSNRSAAPDLPSGVVWRTVVQADPAAADRARRALPTVSGGLLQFTAAALAALAILLLVAMRVSASMAESVAISDARRMTSVLATTVLEPQLSPAILRGDPAALDRLRAALRVTTQAAGGPFVRIKLWTGDGRIVFSDQADLIGQRFPLHEEEVALLRAGEPVAKVSTVSLPENRLEQGQRKLLEVYLPARMRSGEVLLFESYSPYAQVEEQRRQVWGTFAPVIVGSLVLLALFLLPLTWSLLHRLSSVSAERERLLRRAVEASDDERRRIAGNLHDGVVQSLAGASMLVAGAVEPVARAGRPEESERLATAASGLRDSIRGLRSLLVEIYPPNLRAEGLAGALADLGGPLRAAGTSVVLDVPELDLTANAEALIYRVAQEAVRNISRHAAAASATLALRRERHRVILTVTDTGAGMDLDEKLSRPGSHMGLRILQDLARDAGATLRYGSAPGRGTTVVLEVPLP